MPLPSWLQQEYYENYLAEEKAFQEWLKQIELDMEVDIDTYYAPIRQKVRIRRR